MPRTRRLPRTPAPGRPAGTSTGGGYQPHGDSEDKSEVGQEYQGDDHAASAPSGRSVTNLPSQVGQAVNPESAAVWTISDRRHGPVSERGMTMPSASASAGAREPTGCGTRTHEPHSVAGAVGVGPGIAALAADPPVVVLEVMRRAAVDTPGIAGSEEGGHLRREALGAVRSGARRPRRRALAVVSSGTERDHGPEDWSSVRVLSGVLAARGVCRERVTTDHLPFGAPVPGWTASGHSGGSSTGSVPSSASAPAGPACGRVPLPFSAVTVMAGGSTISASWISPV